MSLDAFSVVLAFLAVVEAGLGGTAVVLGAREFRAPGTDEAQRRRPLLALVAAATVGVAVLSLPLHYLLLESWVPRWPGVMCVEGVRRIGTGTLGAARWLPSLLAALDWTRLLVIFAAGAWLLLRRIPGSRKAALAAVLFGLLALLDGAASFAYVVLPKQEILPAAGCCTAAPTPGLAGGEVPAALGPGFAAGAALLGAGALALRRRRSPALLVPFALLGACALPLGARFLAEVAGPWALGLPFHHCAWCAFAGAPETIAGALLLVGAALSAGWAPLAGERGGRFLAAAAAGFLAVAAMGSVPVLFPSSGPALRAGGGPRCALDGVRIDPSRRVVVVEASGRERALCCVDCATRWLERAGEAPREVRVVDEATGAELPAGKAWFVRSRVLAFPPCACRVHVFAREEDARRHAEDFGGIVRAWEGAER